MKNFVAEAKHRWLTHGWTAYPTDAGWARPIPRDFAPNLYSTPCLSAESYIWSWQDAPEQWKDKVYETWHTQQVHPLQDYCLTQRMPWIMVVPRGKIFNLSGHMYGSYGWIFLEPHACLTMKDTVYLDPKAAVGTYLALHMDLRSQATIAHKIYYQEGHHMTHIVVNQKDDSQYTGAFSLQGQATFSHRKDTHTLGAHTRVNLQGLVEVEGEHHWGVHYHHHGHDSRSEQHVDQAITRGRSVYHGYGHIPKHLTKIHVHQYNRNLLQSDQAVAKALPELHVHAKDTVCSHGSATGGFRPDLLHYLYIRGFDPDQAKALILQGWRQGVGQNLPKDLQDFFA